MNNFINEDKTQSTDFAKLQVALLNLSEIRDLTKFRNVDYKFSRIIMV